MLFVYGVLAKKEEIAKFPHLLFAYYMVTDQPESQVESALAQQLKKTGAKTEEYNYLVTGKSIKLDSLLNLEERINPWLKIYCGGVLSVNLIDKKWEIIPYFYLISTVGLEDKNLNLIAFGKYYNEAINRSPDCAIQIRLLKTDWKKIQLSQPNVLRLGKPRFTVEEI